jgi:hypothetical protein
MLGILFFYNNFVQILFECFILKKAFLEHKEENPFELLFGQDLDLQHEATHNKSIYKGLATFFGIYAFFLIETITQLRQVKEKKNQVKV